MTTENPSFKEYIWFASYFGLPNDVVIEVDGVLFVCNKIPLMSKSRKLRDLIKKNTNLQIKPVEKQGNSESDFEFDEEACCYINFRSFPGGPDVFRTTANFCYDMKFEPTSSNVAPLRCIAELLEMTDYYSADNLISISERFLSQTLRDLQGSIKMLKSCEQLMPHAETLGIVDRCIESVAALAPRTSMSIWPVNETASGNLMETSSGGRTRNIHSWFFRELTNFRLPMFKRLISAKTTRDLMSSDVTESCLIAYARRHIPGIISGRGQNQSSDSVYPSNDVQIGILETIIANLPCRKSTSVASSKAVIKFLFRLLKVANILNVSRASRDALEKKIGSQFELATLDDLLIASYSNLNETLDVGCVERMLGYFFDELEEKSASRRFKSEALMLVGKLMDYYLSEIASDPNLKQENFYTLALVLPDHARQLDDGLYRALDIYLTKHPWLEEAEKEKICGVMNCEKLTFEACTHAVQNERLPMRVMFQVFSVKHLELGHEIARTLHAAAETARTDVGQPSNRPHEEKEGEVVEDAREKYRENQLLRTRVKELELERSTLKEAIEKIGKVGGGGGAYWLARAFGCKFMTQVCDRHKLMDGYTRRRRNHRH